MATHVFRRKIKLFWRKRIVRAAVGILVLGGAILLQYDLANIPTPINFDDPKNKFTPPPVRLGQDELVLENLILDSATGLLLSNEGRPDEFIDANMDQARLSDESIEEFKQDLKPFKQSPPPPTIGSISYLTPGGSPTTTDAETSPSMEDAETPPVGDEACSTHLEVRWAGDRKPLSEVHFFQKGKAGFQKERHLEMSVSGGEVLVRIGVVTPLNGNYNSPACRKSLSLDSGKWKKNINGDFDVAIVVAATSRFEFRFLPMTKNNSLWAGSDGLYEPFHLGSPKLKDSGSPSLQAQALNIKALDKVSTSLSIKSVDERNPIHINNLKIGSDQLQFTLSGKGFVKVNGEDMTESFFVRIGNYPLIAGLLAVANTALIAWVIGLVRGLFSDTP